MPPSSERGVPEEQTGPEELAQLLGSQTRARLLTVFCTHPDAEFYPRQLARETGAPLRPVQRELARLERLGILTARRQGQELLYRANRRHPFFPELTRLVYKSAAMGDVVRRALDGLSGVLAAFIYGSVARGDERASSDVDLFILGTPDRGRLAHALHEAEAFLGREINLTTMTLEEWRERAAQGDAFIEELLQSPKIFLVGNEQSLPRA